MTYTRLPHRLVVCLLTIACLLVAAPQASAAKGDLTDEQIGKAIDKIKKYFYDSQDASGAWFGSYHNAPEGGNEANHWGPSAMALLALIVSGESPQHPDIKRGLELLAEQEFNGVYAFSMRIHLWSYLPKGVFGQLLADDSQRMLQTAYDKSRFNYWLYGHEKYETETKRIDNSTTQYGILAMWQASKRGAKIPDGFWQDAVENFLTQQNDDGGWSYRGNRNSSQTMTCAGLTVLYVAQQELFRDQSTPNQAVTDAINKGLAFLDKEFGGKQKVHGGTSYKYYGYERVALAAGRKYFGGKDWFQTIAKEIISENAKYGPEIQNASFDLMFLSRGRVPVWINKLEIPGYAWNNRPNDIYFLNKYISDYREQELNWQTISVDSTSAEDWLSAPLMWISGSEYLELTEDQTKKLKTYLDLGGTLVINPEGGSSSFRASVRDLAEKMYPDLTFESMSADDPMASLLEGDPRRAKAPPIEVLHNGARSLIVMPQKDWGMTFQKDEKPNPDKTEAWKYITNIYGVATDRGELTPRLSSPMVSRTNRAGTGTIKVVVPVWQDPNEKLHETDAYAIMKNYMFNETGKELDVQYLPLSELAGADPALLHLAGVNAVEIKADERQAILDYMKTGGTILIETIAGTGKFSESVNSQLGAAFTGNPDRVSRSSSIISGRGLPEGSQNNRTVFFRRMVLERSNPDAELLLRGYKQGDRYPVLLSYEDLSLGMLGVKQFGINGYSPQSARNLMVNILLEADQAKGN